MLKIFKTCTRKTFNKKSGVHTESIQTNLFRFNKRILAKNSELQKGYEKYCEIANVNNSFKPCFI